MDKCKSEMTDNADNMLSDLKEWYISHHKEDTLNEDDIRFQTWNEYKDDVYDIVFNSNSPFAKYFDYEALCWDDDNTNVIITCDEAKNTFNPRGFIFIIYIPNYYPHWTHKLFEYFKEFPHNRIFIITDSN